MEINDGISEDAIEPDHCAFAISGFVSGLDRLEQTLLHEISGKLRVADARTCETCERIQVRNQGVFGFGHTQQTNRLSAGRQSKLENGVFS